MKYFAELVGTFFLVLAVLLTGASGAFFAALVVGVLVYSLGGISGAHFNPAITLGVLSVKKISAKEAVAYILVQLVGAIGGALIASVLLSAGPKGDVALVSSAMFSNFFNDTLIVGLAEAVGTFFLAFGIASVVFGKTPKDASGAVIGGSLFVGATIAAVASAGTLNPAVALAASKLSVMSIAGPIIGSVAGMWAYKKIH